MGLCAWGSPPLAPRQTCPSQKDPVWSRIRVCLSPGLVPGPLRVPQPPLTVCGRHPPGPPARLLPTLQGPGPPSPPPGSPLCPFYVRRPLAPACRTLDPTHRLSHHTPPGAVGRGVSTPGRTTRRKGSPRFVGSVSLAGSLWDPRPTPPGLTYRLGEGLRRYRACTALTSASSSSLGTTCSSSGSLPVAMTACQSL